MRTLTGNYYLHKRFFGGYDVMVEIISSYTCVHDGSRSPEYKTYSKATEEDIARLCINKNTK